jgi:hypothetical protein
METLYMAFAFAFALGRDNKYSTKHMAYQEALQKCGVTLCVNRQWAMYSHEVTVCKEFLFGHKLTMVHSENRYIWATKK